MKGYSFRLKNAITLLCIFSLFVICGCNNTLTETQESTSAAQEQEEIVLEWVTTGSETMITYGEKSESYYQITQLPFPTFWGGAAYSIITPSGDLYLVDGGFQGEDGERILHYIAAHGWKVKGWILTHPHVDHIGAFLDYMALHPDTVEKVYYSPFTTEFFEEEEDPEIYKLINNAILYYEFLTIKEATQEQVEYIPMVSGDILMLDELKLECFASFDPEIKDVNGNSLVFTLSYNDFTLLLTGDMTEATLNAIQNTADEDAAIWDTDVIQIPHHGYYGGITQETLYRATGARLALLDCTKEEFENNSAQIQNTIQMLEGMELPYITRFSAKGGNFIYLYQ